MATEEVAVAPTKVPLQPIHPDLLLGVDRGMSFDLGLLAGFSYQPIDPSAVKEKGLKQFLDDEGRDCTQLLLNEILRVPTTRTPQGEVLGSLPPITTPLPREKHMPTPKPPTRWEKFAAIKGIKKKKKSKIAWDETEQTWKRTHGYDKANDEQGQWLIEVKSSDPAPHEDPWKRLADEKKERVKKQKKQEERNRAETQTFAERQAKQQGLPPPPPRVTPKELKETVDVVNKSTASLGKFHEKLPNEPKHQRIKGKRKFEPVVAPAAAAAGPKAANNKNKKAKKESGGGEPGAAAASAHVPGEKKLNLTIFENLMNKQEKGDPSFVPDKKVLEMQKKKLGKRDRKNAY